MKNKMKLYGLWALLSVLAVGGNASGGNIAETVRELPALQIQVTLSPVAQKTLAHGRENITLSTSWYGWPAPQWQTAANEVGQIELGRSEITLPALGGVAKFTPQKIKSERLHWLKGAVYVNVNVYSARHHWADNILACDFIDGALTDVARNSVTLHCSLISEQMPTRQVSH